MQSDDLNAQKQAARRAARQQLAQISPQEFSAIGAAMWQTLQAQPAWQNAESVFGSVENHGEERFAARIFATAGLGVALLHSDVALKLRITADLECVATIRRMFGYSLERRMYRFVELAHCGDEQIEIQPDQHFLILS